MVVPEGWEEVTLESICLPDGLIRGPFGGSLKKEIFLKKGYKIYEQKNAIYASIKIGTYYISPDKYRELNRFAVTSGDFIVSCSGTIGCIYELPMNSPKGVINQALLKITIDYSKIDKEFFRQYFISSIFQKTIIDDTQGGAMQNLVGMSKFKKTLFLIPQNISEQRRIAEVLSDTDAYIHSLKKLIEKKEAVKQGVMQELLTGKKRLPGFTGEWIEKRLGEVSEIVMGQSPQSHSYSYNINGLPLIQGNTNIKNRKTVAEIYTSHITKIARTGDIILTVRAPVGVVGRATFNCCMGRGVCALKGNDFLYHTLIFIEPRWTKLSKGSTFDSVTGQDIYNIFIRMPPTLAEQTAIANILSDMDKEIEVLKKKLKKIESIKQGMMQKLLTGEIRLLEETEGAQEDRHYKLKNQDESLYAAEKVESYKTPFIKG